jgi:hypothetical protein
MSKLQMVPRTMRREGRMGREVTMKEACELAQAALRTAERERLEAAEREAQTEGGEDGATRP